MTKLVIDLNDIESIDTGRRVLESLTTVKKPQTPASNPAPVAPPAASVTQTSTQQVTNAPSPVAGTAPTTTAPATVAPAPAPAPAPVAAMTIEEANKALQAEFVRLGNDMAPINEVFKEMGVTSLSDLHPDNYADCINRVKAK
jgi:hypothetical protein